jgi:hypothetical protein
MADQQLVAVDPPPTQPHQSARTPGPKGLDRYHSLDHREADQRYRVQQRVEHEQQRGDQ